MDDASKTNARSGGQILVDQLAIQGVRHVFCVPGESYLAALDAFHDSTIELTVCRQETGAGIMADAYARLTGETGVVFVTRGPGAMNAAHAIHIAEHDSTPLVMFVGQIGRAMRGRGAFQEMDFSKVFGSFAKWVFEVDTPARLPEIVARAFREARQGRPGPVVISLPEDMLRERASIADAVRVEPSRTWPGASDMQRLREMICASHKPFVIAGGSCWSEEASSNLQAFAERFDLPVVTSFRRTNLFDSAHESYCGELTLGGNAKLNARIKDSDFILLIGGRMAETPSQGYTLFDIPVPRQTFVHVHADARELGRVYQPDLAIHATPPEFCALLAGLETPAQKPWSGERRAARAGYVEFSSALQPVPGEVHPGEIMIWLRGRLPDDAIIVHGAGNSAMWVARYLPVKSFTGYLGPVSGSMGFGVPAAVGAQRAFPDRMVISFNGDGCYMMNGQEFATAVQYNLPVIFVVMDNAMYGTIRMHQERHYPGRITGTHLVNPDFAALARACGGHGETVAETSQFAPAFERAVASRKPSIIHVKYDAEAITTLTTLSQIRDAALVRKG